MTFDKHSTAAEVLDGVDLTEKTIIVTGATSGIGIETARVLASKGANISLTARDMAKAQPIVEEIRQSTGNISVNAAELDLSITSSIRQFASNWLGANERLDVLINNAACMVGPLARTEQGWEMHFGTNHLGHFLLTGLLLPALKAGRPSRVVAVSSSGHRSARSGDPDCAMDFNDLNYAERKYDRYEAYNQSKLANVWFAYEFNKRFSSLGIEAFSLDPGSVVGTGLSRDMDKDELERIMNMSRAAGKFFKTVPQGAATSVWAAISAELTGKGGVYLNHCQIAEPAVDDSEGHALHAYDDAGAERLWEISEQLVGEKFRL